MWLFRHRTVGWHAGHRRHGYSRRDLRGLLIGRIRHLDGLLELIGRGLCRCRRQRLLLLGCGLRLRDWLARLLLARSALPIGRRGRRNGWHGARRNRRGGRYGCGGLCRSGFSANEGGCDQQHEERCCRGPVAGGPLKKHDVSVMVGEAHRILSCSWWPFNY